MIDVENTVRLVAALSGVVLLITVAVLRTVPRRTLDNVTSGILLIVAGLGLLVGVAGTANTGWFLLIAAVCIGVVVFS